MLQHFAEVNDAAAATAKKLQKQAVLADYFRSLDEGDLRLAVRFTGGRPFAVTGQRTLGVGGAIVWDVTLALAGLDPITWHEQVVRHGEIGDALAAVWDGPGFVPQRNDETSQSLAVFHLPMDRDLAAPQIGEAIPAQHVSTADSQTEPAAGAGGELILQDLGRVFDSLASTGVIERKRNLLFQLLSRCKTGREAAYIIKIISGDLRTGVQEGGLAAAIAQAFDRPIDSVRRCTVLLGDLEDVAVLAKRDALGSAKFRLFHPLQFMLATPQESDEIAAVTMAGRTFWAEDKLDGIRAQIHKSGRDVAIYTRTMNRAEESFPDVVETILNIPGDFLLDGEIVPYRDGKVLPFAQIQKRLGRKKLSARTVKENPAAFIAFDLLYDNGVFLIDEPLRVRRERLIALSGINLTTVTEVSSAAQITAAFDDARGRRNEGLVLKDSESPYSPGRRGKMWLKLKTHLPTVDCVVTAAEFGHGKRRNTLSDYTFAVWTDDPLQPEAQLVNVGKAYSGVTDDEITQLTEIFLQISRRQIGRVHLVEPKIVLEIAFDQIQKSTIHAGGYALRFPRIKRIRWDKRPEDADRISRIAEIYESTQNFAKGIGPPVEYPEPTLFD